MLNYHYLADESLPHCYLTLILLSWLLWTFNEVYYCFLYSLSIVSKKIPVVKAIINGMELGNAYFLSSYWISVTDLEGILKNLLLSGCLVFLYVILLYT